MALPDVIVRVFGAVTPASQPTDTATLFDVGATQRGPSLKPVLLRSLNDFITYFGARLAEVNSTYDWVETFFNEGGSELWLQRVFGSGAKAASLELKKSAAQALVVEAGQSTLTPGTTSRVGETDPGTWGNGIKVAVIAGVGGGTYRLQIEYEGALVEETPDLTTQEDAVAWAKGNSRYVVITKGTGTEPPATAAAAALTGGTAGAGIADADFATALAKIPKELGPGQVSAHGQTAEARQKAVLAHAVANNRFALLDGTDTATVATLVAQAQALYTAPSSGRRYGQLLAPWEIIPGLTSSTTRTVAPSARLAAQYAKLDSLGNPNRAAAGTQRGSAQFVIDLSQPGFSEQGRLELNNAGVTVSRRRYGNRVATWGLRTLADQVADENWSEAPSVRTIMAYVALAEVGSEEYDFDQVDGFGTLQGKLAGELMGIASRFFDIGALYGRSPSQAFSVNVGEQLNPVKALSEGKVTAQVGLRVSPNDEQVVVQVVKAPITQELP